MSAVYDLEFHQGEHWYMIINVADGDGATLDITGSTLEWRLSTPAGVTTMTRTSGDGLSVISGADGECSLAVSPAQQVAAAVTPSLYQWEFRCTTAAERVTVQARGHWRVLPSLFA